MRLKELARADLTNEQAALYDRIASGPRASGRQLFALADAAGRLNGPFGLMLHVPALGGPLQELGAAIRYQTGLTPRLREIAILSVAAATDSAFERYAHERVGRAAGLTEDELAALASRTFVSQDRAEQAAYEFCEMLNDSRMPLSDADFERLRDQIGETGMLELAVLAGYYRTLSQMLHVFGVGVPD